MIVPSATCRSHDITWPSYLEWFGLFGHAVQCVDGERVLTIQVPPTNVHLEGVVNAEKEGGHRKGRGGRGEGGREGREGS